MPSAADIKVLRDAQDNVRTLVVRDLRAMFASMDLARPDAAAAALREFVPALVLEYGDMAASLAADWYDEVRSTEGIPGRFRASMMPSPYQDAAEPTARRAAGALFTPTPADALTTLLPSVGKYVLAAGRQTITRSAFRDPQASGWQRVTRPGACRFCRMLQGRGDVYKESTVHFAAHGDCNCAASPSWDANAPEVDVSMYRASERTTSMTPEQKADHNARIADWLAENDPSAAQKAGTSTRKAKAPMKTNLDATATTAQLRSTLADLEKSALKFSSPGTVARIEELRRQIAAR